MCVWGWYLCVYVCDLHNSECVLPVYIYPYVYVHAWVASVLYETLTGNNRFVVVAIFSIVLEIVVPVTVVDAVIDVILTSS